MKKYLLVVLFVLSQLFVFAQDEVSLNVTGQGKTLEDAKLDAFRNAIEQSFGAFISSKTELLNDELVKDEIVSLSSGNINDFKILSKIKISDNDWRLTMLATVSIKKLAAFCQSKGIDSEFKGSLFGANVKIEKLKKENELSVIKNSIQACIEMSKQGYEYSIESGNPHLSTKGVRSKSKSASYRDGTYGDYIWFDSDEVLKCEGECYNIPIKVTVKMNDNISEILKYLSNTLEGIKMTESEVAFHKNSNMEFYKVGAIVPKPVSQSKEKKQSKKKRRNKKSTPIQQTEKNNTEIVIYSLRNWESIQFLSGFLANYLPARMMECEVSNGIETTPIFEVQRNYSKVNYEERKKRYETNLVLSGVYFTNYDILGNEHFMTTLSNEKINEGLPFIRNEDLFHFKSSVSYAKKSVDNPGVFDKFYFGLNNSLYTREDSELAFYKEGRWNGPRINFAFDVSEAYFIYNLFNVETLDNLSKISKYSIKPIID